MIRRFLIASLVCLCALRAEAQCTKDTDCKGDRICDGGRCVSPGAAPAPSSTVAPTPTPTPTPTSAPTPAPVPDDASASASDDGEIAPGGSVRGIVLGHSTSSEALAALGTDCQKSLDGTQVRTLNCTLDAEGKFSQRRAMNPSLPTMVEFDTGRGVATKVSWGPQQTKLVLRGGLKAGASAAKAREALGEPDEVERLGSKEDPPPYMETWRYRAGVELMVLHQSETKATVQLVTLVPAAGRKLEHRLPYEEIAPGQPFHGLRPGHSTADDVLAAFGRDAKINRLSTNNQIFSISYDYDAAGAYSPGRDANRVRPSSFDFDVNSGLLASYGLGVYQTGLGLAGDVSVGATADEVRAALGPPDKAEPSSDVSKPPFSQTWTYSDKGIELSMFHYDDKKVTLSSIKIVVPANEKAALEQAAKAKASASSSSSAGSSEPAKPRSLIGGGVTLGPTLLAFQHGIDGAADFGAQLDGRLELRFSDDVSGLVRVGGILGFIEGTSMLYGTVGAAFSSGSATIGFGGGNTSGVVAQITYPVHLGDVFLVEFDFMFGFLFSGWTMQTLSARIGF